MEKTSEILTSLFALRILRLMFSSVSVIPELPCHVVEEEHIIRGNDPSFRPATTEKKEFLLAKENTEGDGVGRGQRRGWTTEVHVQDRQRGGSDWCAGQETAREWWIETKRRLRNPVAVAVRDEGRSELRDPPALRVVIIINLSGV